MNEGMKTSLFCDSERSMACGLEVYRSSLLPLCLSDRMCVLASCLNPGHICVSVCVCQCPAFGQRLTHRAGKFLRLWDSMTKKTPEMIKSIKDQGDITSKVRPWIRQTDTSTSIQHKQLAALTKLRRRACFHSDAWQKCK